MGSPHDSVRQVAANARRLISSVPRTAKAGSHRHRDIRTVKATTGGGGRLRAEFLNRLSVECQVMSSYLTLLIDGVADCLQVAASRDNSVNVPVLSIVVRPALEVAGQLAWLLDDQISADERARRYVIWRLSDLRSQRLLLDQFRPMGETTNVAVGATDAAEAQLLTEISSAKWSAVATVLKPSAMEAAALLDEDGKRLRMPNISQLVRLVSSSPSLYGLLSTPAHGDRHGALQGLRLSDVRSADGSYAAEMSGFGLDPNLAIGTALVSLDISCRLLAGWNGIDSKELHARTLALMERAGFG